MGYDDDRGRLRFDRRGRPEERRPRGVEPRLHDLSAAPFASRRLRPHERRLSGVAPTVLPGRSVPGSDRLDLGCGCGTPGARLLSERFRVTGVDISDVQIERARALVPAGERVRPGDMTGHRSPGPRSTAPCASTRYPRPARGAARVPRGVYRWLGPGDSSSSPRGRPRGPVSRRGGSVRTRRMVLESRRLAHLREVVRPKGVPSAPSDDHPRGERAGTASSSYRSPCRLPDSARGRLAPRAK